MIIHIVQEQETITSIAEKYNVSESRLIIDNGLKNPMNLVVGQTIVIVDPEQTYIVQEGDTLLSIARSYGISVMQLLRNNPFIYDSKVLIPGETLVISYKKSNIKITTNGYVYPFINRDTLKKTLPFLTYLSIFNYRTTAEADIIGIDDKEVIQIAKEYGVAPIMLLSTLTAQRIGSLEVTYSIVSSDELINRQIENILIILRTKGYYGLNVTLQFITAENTEIYNNYIVKLTTRLNKEGYPVWVTITPKPSINVNELTFERIDYSVIGETANGTMLLSYSWGYSFGPPAAPFSISIIREFIDYIVTLIPPEKVYIGIPIIGYDWQLPYEIGVSRANSLTTDSAIALALEKDAVIQFDEDSQAPFFEYVDTMTGVPRQHIVWFKDARSIDSLVKLVPEYGFPGISIWNIMNYFAQMWLVINTQYDIEKIT